MSYYVSFIGAGNMATAIMEGIAGSGLLPLDMINVYDIDNARLEYWAGKGCTVCRSADEAAGKADILIIAVKPQNITEVLGGISVSLKKGGVLVSIAAGVSIERIKALIGDYPVVRIMPNACMTVSQGASAVSHSDDVSAEQLEKVMQIFRSCGSAAVIDEEQQNSVIFVHGSSPAVIFKLAKAVVDEAQAEGIDPDSALELFCSTLCGCAKMLTESGKTPDELIKIITSKGGTTEAALRVLDNAGFYDSIREAMIACGKRAEELGKM